MAWTWFKELFFNKYFPTCMKNEMEMKFLGLKQEGMSVSEYLSRFLELSSCGQPGHLSRDCPQKGVRQEVETKGNGTSTTKPFQQSAPRAVARTYALTTQDAEKSHDVVSGTLQICAQDVHVLFDSGSTHSFVDTKYVDKLNVPVQSLDNGFLIKLPNGRNLFVDKIYRDYPLMISEQTFLVDLLPLELRDFRVILGMDWLSKHRANLNYHKKRICLTGSNKKKVYFKGDSVEKPSAMISILKACKMLRKVCEGFLAYVVENEGIKNKIEDTPVVREFLDVFPEELPNLPPEREVEFGIELIPNDQPVSKAPYRMAPEELAELKLQLQGLLDKKFIRPSESKERMHSIDDI
ncbi:uncharacterized protein LOC141718808 [Apium graveolens]|uniref:uncharacterized protein LOC141718808 n=1 Tax=Apium graveolens TaxID=4045 RepID=UPI003D7AE6D7